MTADSESGALCGLVVDRNGGEGSLGAVSSVLIIRVAEE